MVGAGKCPQPRRPRRLSVDITLHARARSTDPRNLFVDLQALGARSQNISDVGPVTLLGLRVDNVHVLGRRCEGRHEVHLLKLVSQLRLHHILVRVGVHAPGLDRTFLGDELELLTEGLLVCL